jgi:hypothetical protein
VFCSPQCSEASFAQSWKVTFSFIMSVCLQVSTWLPLDGFA